MKVLKFGGTSVGSAQRMKDVAKLITGERNIVVLSAMSGTTNSLVEISDYLYKKNPDGANEVINKLAQKYYGHIEELYSTDEYKQKAKELIKHHFDHIRTFTKDLFTLFEEKVVLAQGELISTGMMNLCLSMQQFPIPAMSLLHSCQAAGPPESSHHQVRFPGHCTSRSHPTAWWWDHTPHSDFPISPAHVAGHSWQD